MRSLAFLMAPFAGVMFLKKRAPGAPCACAVSSRFRTRILLPVAAVMVATLSLGTFSIFWAVQQSNDVSIDRQLRTTERSIKGIVRELAEQQEVVAIWDEAVLELRNEVPSQSWLDENFGLWLNRTFGHNQVFILNAKNEPLYAALEGERVNRHTFEVVRWNFQADLQDLHRRRTPPFPQKSGVLADTGHLTSGLAVYRARTLKLLGRPAAVSFMRIVPHTNIVERDFGTEFVLVSVRFLDASFLDKLSDRNLIEGLRFAPADVTAEGEVSVPLKSGTGETIGYFIWMPELPGTRILGVIGPAVAAASLVMIALMAWLVRWLRHAMLKLEGMVFNLRRSEAKAHHLAFHDVLTGLPNRALFDKRADEALENLKHGERIAVHMIDLDRFKHVNDTWGHHAGDTLIRELAGRLTEVLGPKDIMARLGGDEFAIMQPGIEGAGDAEALCERILDVLLQPFDVFGYRTYVGTSIGFALAPEAGRDRMDLMRKADIALYRAKADGRNCYRIFTPAMDEAVKVRSLIEDDLRNALATGEGLEVAYQPQVSIDGGAILGLEALMRWRHPTRGTIHPRQFIPVAEQTGLIVQLGDWVLRQACAESRRWPDLYMSVNLSPVQFRTQNFAEHIVGIVRETGADPCRIEFEVTESVLLDEESNAVETLRQLRAAGFRIALDDFGTGYSSLGYLHRFVVDKIKIDRSFVHNLGQETNATAIVGAIVALGQAMDLTVTAEGVETEFQKLLLHDAGCTELQGFLFSEAISADKIAQLLSRPPQAA